MKKTIYIATLASLLAGTTLTSCSDFLEADNKTTANKTADDYLIDHPDELLNQTYASTYDFAYNVSLNEEGTDLYMPVRGKSASGFDQYTLNAANSDVYSYYKSLYTTINNANAVIYYNDMKIAEQVAADSTYKASTEQNGYYAEAKFLRCWCYYLLTQQFGNVPYVLDYYNDYKQNFPRTERSEIYDKCIAELAGIYNQNILPTVSSHSNKAQPTQEACAALISKFYLAKGWDIDTAESDAEAGTYTVNSTDNFSMAASWAETAINKNSLDMTFEDKWSPSNDNNKEVLWAIQSDRTAAVGAHSLQNDYGNYYGEYTKVRYKNVGSNHAQTSKSLYLFAKGDTRYDATFMTTIHNTDDSYSGTQSGYYSYYTNPSFKKVGYQYFPYYYSDNEVQAILKANKANYKYSASAGNNEDVRAFLLADICKVYTFNEDGSYSTSEGQYKTVCQAGVGYGVCVKKFDDPEGILKSDDDYRCIPVFHLSDMYLTAAEAWLMVGSESKALEYINAVRARAYGGYTKISSINDIPDGATLFTSTDGKTFKEVAIPETLDASETYYVLSSGAYLSDLSASTYSKIYEYSAAQGGFTPLDILLDERGREMYAERTRWIDLRRTKQLTRYNKAYNPNLQSSVKTLRPIPTNEMGSNTGITEQNPGY